MDKTKVDAVVVGAGIVGLSVAFELSERGKRVLLVDPAEPGSGCSSGNAGAVSSLSITPLAMPGALKSGIKMLLSRERPLHIPIAAAASAAPWLKAFVSASSRNRVQEITAALHSLLSYAVDQHLNLASRVGADHLVRRSGQLHLYRNPDELQKDRTSWGMRRSHGVEWVEVNRDEIAELEPALRRSFDVGIYAPNEGMVTNPFKYAAHIQRRLQERGATIVRDRIVDLKIVSGEVIAAVGANDIYGGSDIVICAGAWSSELLSRVGYRIPLEPHRGYHIELPDAGTMLNRPICLAARKVFISPMDFGLRAAGIVEFGGLKRPPVRRRVKQLQDAVCEAFEVSQVGAQKLASTEDSLWMGHRPCLPDSMPVLGRSMRHNRLWFAFGHGHLGLTGAAGTAVAIAREIAHEPSNLDLRPFRAERFDVASLH